MKQNRINAKELTLQAKTAGGYFFTSADGSVQFLRHAAIDFGMHAKNTFKQNKRRGF